MAKQKTHWRDNLSSGTFQFLINCWPPFLGAGIKVTKITPDYRHVDVCMKQHWYNTNYVGTHFGGSMCSMTDPFYMLILLKNLGKDYIVWDKASSIEFKEPGRGTLRATFTFSEDELLEIREKADSMEKYVFDRPVDIMNEKQQVVATVTKTLYVRRKDRDMSKEQITS